MQAAWEKLDVPQCGYCQSGQVMAAAALLAKNKKPTDADIDAAMTRHPLPLRHLSTHPRRDQGSGEDARLTETPMTTPTLINASRRDFLAGGTGLLLGLYLPDRRGPGRRAGDAPVPPRRRRRLRAERLRAHRQRQHRHRHRQAPGDGPGRLHRPRDHRRRRARRRVGAGQGRGRAGRRRALQQPVLGPGAGHRRLDGDRQLLGSAAQRRRRRPRDAGGRRRQAVERRADDDRREERRGVTAAATGRRRSASSPRPPDAKPVPDRGQAQGPEGLRVHRQARAAQGHEGQEQRQRACSPPT